MTNQFESREDFLGDYSMVSPNSPQKLSTIPLFSIGNPKELPFILGKPYFRSVGLQRLRKISNGPFCRGLTLNENVAAFACVAVAALRLQLRT